MNTRDRLQVGLYVVMLLTIIADYLWSDGLVSGWVCALWVGVALINLLRAADA